MALKGHRQLCRRPWYWFTYGGSRYLRFTIFDVRLSCADFMLGIIRPKFEVLGIFVAQVRVLYANLTNRKPTWHTF